MGYIVIKSTTLLILISVLIGCSPRSGSITEQSNKVSQVEDITTDPILNESQTTPVEVKPLEKKVAQKKEFDEIQLIWAMPETPVDSYIIYYGFSRDALTNQVELETNKIEILKDPRYGSVYRYYLSKIPIDQVVFVSISARRGSTVSKAGEIIELKPDK